VIASSLISFPHLARNSLVLVSPRWAQPLLDEIRHLDQREVREPGEVGFDLEPDHESRVVRRLGSHDNFGDLDEAARLFLESLLPASGGGANPAAEER
jgi:hypothetical protein